MKSKQIFDEHGKIYPHMLMVVSQYEDRILEVIDTSERYTRGDLQGIVTAIVLDILRYACG